MAEISSQGIVIASWLLVVFMELVLAKVVLCSLIFCLRQKLLSDNRRMVAYIHGRWTGF